MNLVTNHYIKPDESIIAGKLNTDNIQPPLDLQSDKELLENFLNTLDLDINNSDLIDIEPEMRLDKYLYIIKQKEAELAKCTRIAEESINRANNWLDVPETKINSAIEYLSIQMKNYLIWNNKKSMSLPNGKIQMRKIPDAVEIVDEELFLAKADSDLIRHVQESFEPDLKAIKNHIKTTSELPAGVELKKNDDKFYYKLAD